MALRLHYLRSLAELRAQAAAWDDLWARSGTEMPVVRAELIAQWVEQFRPDADFCAVVVQDEADWVAALPLVGGRVARFVPLGRFPENEWCPCGDLLWDPAGDSETLDVLVGGLRSFPWPLLWLEGVRWEEAAWRRFQTALEHARLPWRFEEETQVGVVDCTGDWEAMQADWSGNHRRHLRKAANKADAEGGVALRIHRDFADDAEIARHVRRGFEIEDRSWKGTGACSSVLKTPGLLEYYTRQAQSLAEGGQLQLVFLEHAGRPIAFEFGWLGKGVYFTPKVGFDEEFSRFSPGQLLRRELYERIHRERDVQRVDFTGNLSEATAKWITSAYPVGRLVLGTGSVWSRALVGMYNWRRGKTAKPQLNDKQSNLQSQLIPNS